MYEENLTVGPNGVDINIFKGLIILMLCVFLQSCVFDPKPPLSVKIINHFKYPVYIDVLNDCDSCEIQQDVRLFCDGLNDTSVIPRVINAGDSIVAFTQTYYIAKLGVINADSLSNYCRHELKYNIFGKPWVKVFLGTVNQKNKTCKFILSE
jgi:hypothetical protein